MVTFERRPLPQAAAASGGQRGPVGAAVLPGYYPGDGFWDRLLSRFAGAISVGAGDGLSEAYGLIPRYLRAR